MLLRLAKLVGEGGLRGWRNLLEHGYNLGPFSLQVLLWDMDKYCLIRRLDGHHNDVVACAFSPDGALLATASYDTRVCLWDPYTGVALMEFG